MLQENGMLLYKWLGRGQEKNPALIHSSQQHHESYDGLAQARGHYNKAGGFESRGGQIQLEEPLLYGLRQ